VNAFREARFRADFVVGDTARSALRQQSSHERRWPP